MIIPALYERQKQRGGYLTDADMKLVAENQNVPLHRVNSLVTFFPHFRTQPPPKVEVHVCRDMSCHLNGSVEMTQELSQWADDKYGGDVQVCGVSCLGRCDRAPAAMINDRLVAVANQKDLRLKINAVMDGKEPQFNTDWEIAKSKVGKWEMDIYNGEGRYDIVQKFVSENWQSDTVTSALEYAGLLGLGGPGQRAFKKWQDVLEAVGSKKYIVCNADESEPGTFKDREILLAAPHLTIEGMIVAALVVGATQGWIYIRHEYPEQVEMCRKEIQRAKQIGACGQRIFGSNRSFELSVYVSPGGYICGEQTALIEAMEDKRAEPRNRPPELMTNGYLDQPTLLSNVETFAWVPAILIDSGDWFSRQATTDAAITSGIPNKDDTIKSMKGKRLFSISGDVAKPGVYEVPTGTTLGDLIDQHAGGMKDGKKIAAVALSGPSGGLLPPIIPVDKLGTRSVPAGTTEIDVRDLPLDINVARKINFMLGAGIVIYGEGCDVLSEAVANSRFFRNESCGKCVPCRIGSQKITEMGEQLLSGKIKSKGVAQVDEIAEQLSYVMRETSICGLGQVASNPLRSILRFFPESLPDS